MSEDENHSLVIEINEVAGPVDRLWLRLVAEPEERVFGAGEQFSYLSLRGHSFPMWTREQGKRLVLSSRYTFITASINTQFSLHI